ncbi:hypothetical protein [Sediminibacillus albus]|uniref:Uncharacterized protein n=1 Tax=Sediminibacillus albus TaxID=407036 RepID=A0A1G9B5V1_9BACI|nr:hypothetical protein [Sediminibacillus albus]SDK34255.1 hypothetical protein SAMN05216243_2799 [Sediminibacillus albus]
MVGYLSIFHGEKTTVAEHLASVPGLEETQMLMEQEAGGTLAVYVYDTTKTAVWQAVLELECSGLIAGYGFGDTKSEAWENGHAYLTKRMKADV